MAIGADFEDQNGDISFCWSSLWNYNGVKSDIDSVAQRGTNQVLTVSFTQQENIFVEDNFQRMVEYLEGYIARGTIEVGDIVAAVEEKKEVEQDEEARKAALKEKAADIQRQIDELSAQIRAVFETDNDFARKGK